MRKVIRGSMKQQDAYKILAAFLVITMLGSVFAYMFTGTRDDTTQVPDTPNTNTEKYNSELWTVQEPFNSISDALSMTPQEVVTAQFIDIDSMSPQMKQWATQYLQVIQEVDSLYKSNTTKLYYAKLQEGKNESFLLLSTMYPEKNDFEYIVLPNTNNVLQRQDTGLLNIMGSPVIYAPDKTMSDVLQIIYGLNESVTAYDHYESLLIKVEPVPYQVLTSNVSFAKQFYMGIGLANGSYERTTVYLDANSTVLQNLNLAKVNSAQKGFEEYNIDSRGNYTIVKIVSPELFKVLDEETT